MISKSINRFVFIYVVFFSYSLFASDLVLPEAVSNNAVATIAINQQDVLFSFNGLGKGKTYADIHSAGFSVNLSTGETKALANLPDGLGRLASSAVTVRNRIYIIGGYTVAEDLSEISTPQIYEYLPDLNDYRLVTNMPIPVDDSVALVFKQRFIYLVSGWHDTNNVDNVQVFDTENEQWFEATSFPGAPVFGHAGGIVGNRLLIVDGVKVEKVISGKRQYGASSENWLGEIDSNNPAKIVWKKIPKHPYKPLYRMAAVGVDQFNRIVFAGGSDNPYNFNGIGYNKEPSKPSNLVFSFDLNNKTWRSHQKLQKATMDHRGLLLTDSGLFIVGGMLSGQKVTNIIQKIPLSVLSTIKGVK